MAGYRHWYIAGHGDYGVRIQAGDQVLGREGIPGAYVHNDGRLACLDAAGLDELARAAAEAAVDVRQRTVDRAGRQQAQVAEAIRRKLEGGRG